MKKDYIKPMINEVKFYDNYDKEIKLSYIQFKEFRNSIKERVWSELEKKLK